MKFFENRDRNRVLSVATKRTKMLQPIPQNPLWIIEFLKREQKYTPKCFEKNKFKLKK